MKRIFRVFATALLVVLLSFTVVAGDMDFPVVPPPPPPSAPTNVVTTYEEPKPPTNEDGSVLVTTTEIALEIIRAVLALF